MKPFLAAYLKDGYKVGHKFQYPKGTSLVYSNLTARNSRIPGADGVIAFGFQYFVQNHLIDNFRENFFWKPKHEILEKYKRRMDNYLGPGLDISHIADLHDLGWLPLEIKAVPEGTLVPFRVPLLTIKNTKPEFFWLTNMLETIMSSYLWRPITSATTALGYRRTFDRFAKETGAPLDFVKWQGHDFSMRGMDPDAAIVSGAAHLLFFTGTDTIPAIDFLEEYYGADAEKELIAGSVPATEHSVMSMGLQDGELETFKRLITEVYPKGIVSIVSDTWDFWKVLTEYLPALKDIILARDGKVVIRPDSGDPVDIICGDPTSPIEAVRDGAIGTLYKIFGGKTNSQGYIELDPHIGLIYGDSITPTRQVSILAGLKNLGFASSNVVLGIGSYTYQHVTRDTYGLAMKATYGERRVELGLDMPAGWKTTGYPIFKKPATDDGTKNSAKGLLAVWNDLEKGIWVEEDVSWHKEGGGILQTIFKDGVPMNIQTLAQIRARVERYLC